MDRLSHVRFRLLLAALLLLLISYPYPESVVESRMMLIVVSAVFVTGVISVASTRLHLLVAAALGLGTVVFNWWDVSGGWSGESELLFVELGLASEIAFFFYVLSLVGKTVFRSPSVTADTIAGSICVYLLLGLSFCSAYVLMERVVPGSFHIPNPTSHPFSDLLFFSFTALTTVGYGDITPATAQARSIASLETTTGVLYTTILVARLVSLYQTTVASEPAAPADPS